MRFDSTAFTTVLALASSAPIALAANCYSTSGCQTCESRDSVYSARENLCNSDKWKSDNTFNWGWATINLSGRFNSQQACWDGFENIIEQCYGNQNGGTYDWNYAGDSAHLDVSFCSCR